MSELKEKIKDIFSRVDIAANGQISTSYWSDADNNLSAPDGMDYWEWIEQASNEALNEADTMQVRIDELVFSLDDRDCYIADADMKNAELTARITELEAMSAEVISMLSSGKYKHDCSKIVGVIIKALKDNS
tara:strand:- start:763 stop:1158 length:396 start_codon:yes stop_codon:yes gene_type:complete